MYFPHITKRSMVMLSKMNLVIFQKTLLLLIDYPSINNQKFSQLDNKTQEHERNIILISLHECFYIILHSSASPWVCQNQKSFRKDIHKLNALHEQSAKIWKLLNISVVPNCKWGKSGG